MVVKLKSGKEINVKPITKPQALDLLGRMNTASINKKEDYIIYYDACKMAGVDPEELELVEILEAGEAIFKENVLSPLDKKKS